MSAVRNVSDWHQLGVKLGLEMSQLREIEQSYHVEGVSRMKSEMLDLWLRSTPSATWEELVIVLREMGESVVAGEVAVSYCGGPLTAGSSENERVVFAVCKWLC